MSIFVVDVESDGPAPGLYSMISVGVVRLDRDLKTTFKATFAPISPDWIADALAVSGFTRQRHEACPDPAIGMADFAAFLTAVNSGGRPTFISDNPAFDWQWVNYYFHRYQGANPFGHSGRRIGDLYAGLVQRFGAASEWKAFRRTKHTHDPVDDAIGNAEALLHMADQFGLKIPGI